MNNNYALLINEVRLFLISSNNFENNLHQARDYKVNNFKLEIIT